MQHAPSCRRGHWLGHARNPRMTACGEDSGVSSSRPLRLGRWRLPKRRCPCRSSKAAASATASGMAQDGAFWMAKAGATAPQILGHFYPGTTLAKSAGPRCASPCSPGPAMTVAFPNGGRIDERGEGSAGAGLPDPRRPRRRGARATARSSLVVDQARSVRTRHRRRRRRRRPSRRATSTTLAVNTRCSPCCRHDHNDTAHTNHTGRDPRAPCGTRAPPLDDRSPLAADARPTAAPSPSSTVSAPTAGRSTSSAHRQRRARLNQVDVEHYLRGMGEVRDPSWPAAALRTQAVAARTYALRAMAAAGEFCDGHALPGVPRQTGRVRGDGQGGDRHRRAGSRL